MKALKSRFGERAYEDPMADLKSLTQTGSLQEYMEEFDVLFNKVTLTEEYFLSCFLSGLKEEIKIPVKMIGPSSLQQAYALARMQESYLMATRNYRTYSNKPPLLPAPKQPLPPLLPTPNTIQKINNNTTIAKQPTLKTSTNTKLPFQPRTIRLSDEEINEKRAKNLCFWYDE